MMFDACATMRRMEVSYQLTREDVIAYYKANRNRSKYSKLSLVLCVLLAAALEGWAFYQLTQDPDAFTLYVFIIPTFLFPPVLWAMVYVALPRWAARTYMKKTPSAQGSKTMSADESGVRWHWDGGSMNAEWKNYTCLLEGSEHFVLRSSPLSGVVVPKRSMTAEQVSEFRDLATKNIPK